MRLLRGGSLDLLAERPISPQDGSLPGGRLHAAGREALKARSLPVEKLALGEAQRQVGELSMGVDILKALLERTGGPQSSWRSA
jgi:hypothetical protein